MPVNSLQIVWECREDGGALNGGGFCPTVANAGTDYSLQAAAQLTLTDIATTDGANGGTFTITSVTGGFTAAMIGNIGCIETRADDTDWGGGRVLILTCPDTNTITVQAIDGYTLVANATCDSGHFTVGGYLSSPHLLMGRKRTGEQDSNVIDKGKIWVKAGTLSCADFSSVSAADFATPYDVEGYTTTRGDGAPTKPVLQLTNAASPLVNFDGDRNTWKHIVFDANSNANICCVFGFASGVMLYDVDFTGAIKWGIYDIEGVNTILDTFRVYGNGDTAMTVPGFPISGGVERFAPGPHYHNGWIHDNIGPGMYLDDAGSLDRCRIYNNQGPGIYIDYIPSSANAFSHLTIDRNVLDGILLDYATAGELFITNCALTNNGGYGIKSTSTDLSLYAHPDRVRNCAFYNNTDGAVLAASTGRNAVTLSAEPWNDYTTADYLPNDTAGGGAALRAAGYPLYLDIGAEQHEDSGGAAPTPAPGANLETLILGTYTFAPGFKVRLDPAQRAIPNAKLPRADGARSIQGYLESKVFIAEGNIYVGPMDRSDYRTRLDAFRAAMAQGPCDFQIWTDRFYRNAQSIDRTNYGPTAFGRLGDVEIEITCPDPYQYSTTEDITTEAVAATGETFVVVTAGNAPSVPQIALTVDGAGAKTIAWTITNQTNGESFTLTGNVTGGQIITVDCLEHTVSDGGQDRTDLFDGQWMTLDPGSNTIEETCGAAIMSQIQVTRRNRWY